MLELSILIVSGAINLILGYIVFSKNPQSVTNRRFLILTCSLVAWSTVNYVSLHPFLLPQLEWIRLVLFFAAFLCLSVYRTFTVFPDITHKQSTREQLAVLSTVIVMGLTLTPLVFSGLAVDNGVASPTPNFGIVLFAALAVSLLGGGIGSLVIKYRRSVGRRRVQLRFVLAGLTGAFGLILLTNLVLVVAFGISTFIPFGSAFTLVFSGAFAYAIIKHRLFDIRKAAARGIAYVLTVGFLAATYSLVLFGVSSLFFEDKTDAGDAQLINTILALVMALSFQTIKRFFDRLSNRVFYKDAYDPQRLLDQLNQALIAEVNLERMLHKTSSIITSNLKASSCTFIIYGLANKPPKIVSDSAAGIRAVDVVGLELEKVSKANGTIITDLLEEKKSLLAQKLGDLNISVLLRLMSGPGHGDKGAGELMLGPKSNGDPYSSEDIRMLEIISKELVIAIQNALRFEEIERFNETLQQKINDATQRLRQSNLKLKKLNDSKDDFIGMASHQLRTPLTSIKGYVSLVMDGDAGKVNATQRKLLMQAFSSAQKMVYLVADLLNVSRLKTGKFTVERKPTNLATLITEEMAQLKEEASVRGLELKFTAPENFPILPLDDTKTRQVVMNFLDNAIYYTPKGGHIIAELKELPNSVEFRVIDDGIGVPKADRHQLFTKFYRARNAQRARPDGTGLGLYMAQKVVLAQGGAVIFDSQEGKGSVFGFTFPKDMPLEMVPLPGLTKD